MATKYKVYWDNGNGACGTFNNLFESEEGAQAFADDWSSERNLEDLGLCPDEVDERGGEGCYTAEAVEGDEPTEEEREGEVWDPVGELRAAALDHKGRP